MEVVRPRWASWSFLLYAGGFTLLGAASFALAQLAGDHGDAGFTGFAFLFFAVAAAVAWALRRDGTHPVAAGIMAVVAVALFVASVGALYAWAGWLEDSDSPFAGFDLARLTFFLIATVAAAAALRLFRFPLLVFLVAAGTWLFVTDLISGGGDWSAIVAFLVGLGFLAAAVALDLGGHHPYAFWLHVWAGLTIGGSLLWFLDDGDLGWALIGVGGLIYVALADRFLRSSWAVLGAIGILLCAAHFAQEDFSFVPVIVGFDDSSNGSGLRAALVFGIAGVVLMALGGLLARRLRAQRVSA